MNNGPKAGSLRHWYRRQQFQPGLLTGLIVNPFYFARRGLLRELKPLLSQLDGEVLDVGCGGKPYREFVPAGRYVGVDIDTPFTRAWGAADVIYDGRILPFASGSFDGVLCSQVLEHVFEPEHFLGEIHRVLRSGGRLVLAVPFSWDEHEQPHDFARYSSFGLRALLERNGFEVSVQRKSTADTRALVQLGSAYLYKVTLTRSLLVSRLVQLAIIAPFNVVGALVSLLLPSNPDFYLDNIVLARKVAASS